MKESENAILTQQQAGNQGCGMGTENACFALTMGSGGATMRPNFKSGCCTNGWHKIELAC